MKREDPNRLFNIKKVSGGLRSLDLNSTPLCDVMDKVGPLGPGKGNSEGS